MIDEQSEILTILTKGIYITEGGFSGEQEVAGLIATSEKLLKWHKDHYFWRGFGELSLCEKCNCMTKKVCGKCKGDKNEEKM